MSPEIRRLQVASLLFCSGLCALIYQTVWLREFRLIFGASTAASAAVLGIFMGGLGLGSAWLGSRAEASRRPLLYYGNLEVLIALAAALTPVLVWLVRHMYAYTGGTMVLGQGIGTVVRLLLASLVLIVPTFLMGGTLPAAARAALREDDLGRRSLALLYGCNTLGAVTGAALSTFWLVEFFGNRQTLWLACGANLIVAMIARIIGQRMPEIEPSVAAATASENASASAGGGVSYRFVVIAAAVVGFAFMLMELVWYRMLGPILGGSTFTFGLILVVALLGIGLGGAAYSLRGSQRPAELSGFAFTCALEAVFLAVPFALGDRIANLALMLRPLGTTFGLSGHVLGWFIVSSVVVLPAAIVAGYQFPMLIALLGRGRSGVAQHTGQAYAANTLGAIIGSLAGGFGLMPTLGALGVWKAVTLVLAALAVAAAVQQFQRQARHAFVSIGVTACAVILLFASAGPTAGWRHSGIGAGRADKALGNPVLIREMRDTYRRSMVWETDGVESNVGITAQSGYAFVVNGKIDGNARFDSGTQVMSGLVGALLHGDAKRSMIVGLGTGSTAGWLGAIPAMERVDVVELEPAILEVARYCAPVNRSVMDNPKVRTHIGDAREVLLATPERYDLIFSEPSNPYRAGIASLFTQDFYRASIERLKPGGLFLQWVQAYEIDGEAIQTVYATLGSVFPHIQTWRTQANDLLLIATREPLKIDAAALRTRIAAEPFREALHDVWRVDSVEGFLAHFLGNEQLARRVVDSGHAVATDDRNSLEFGFARGIGRSKRVNLAEEIVEFSRSQRLDRPMQITGEVNWERVVIETAAFEALYRADTTARASETKELQFWRQIFDLYNEGLTDRAAAQLREPTPPAPTLLALEMVAETFALTKSPQALSCIEAFAQSRPSDAEALRGIVHALDQRFPEAATCFEKAFTAWRTDPWVRPELAQKALSTAQALAVKCGDPVIALRIYKALREPFAVELLREGRLLALVEIAPHTAPNPANPQLREALAEFGPYPLWTKSFLTRRVRAYRDLNDPLLEQAAHDLYEYLNLEPVRFDHGLQTSKMDNGAPAKQEKATPQPEVAAR